MFQKEAFRSENGKKVEMAGIKNFKASKRHKHPKNKNTLMTPKALKYQVHVHFVDIMCNRVESEARKNIKSTNIQMQEILCAM